MYKNLFKTTALALLAMPSFVFLPQTASAQTACSEYTIEGGDTLRSIALAAYGSGNFQPIFNANRNTIGSNPNAIEVGDVLQLPCEDGSLPNTVVEVAVPEVEQTAAAAIASGQTLPQGYVPSIKFLTGGNYAPFTDESLPGRGLYTELVETAMARGAPDREFSITFVNDWGAHLSALLPINAFDLGFPWFRPDCTKLDLLTPSDARRCTDYNWSDPFYEVVVPYFTLPSSRFANISSAQGLIGARICRPEGYATFYMQEEGLFEPDITMVSPVLPNDCFTGLVEGTVDVVSLELDLVEGILAELGLQNEVVEIPGLSELLSLSVLTHKSNPYGRAYVTILNQGLRDMRQSGEWFGIVSTQLAQYARANQ
ncbi:MAG: peptidoglycan-binding protein LysM [Pseudomonadota bacterium]